MFKCCVGNKTEIYKLWCASFKLSTKQCSELAPQGLRLATMMKVLGSLSRWKCAVFFVSSSWGTQIFTSWPFPLCFDNCDVKRFFVSAGILKDMVPTLNHNHNSQQHTSITRPNPTDDRRPTPDNPPPWCDVVINSTSECNAIIL